MMLHEKPEPFKFETKKLTKGLVIIYQRVGGGQYGNFSEHFHQPTL